MLLGFPWITHEHNKTTNKNKLNILINLIRRIFSGLVDLNAL
jgi:hypothetical protein